MNNIFKHKKIIFLALISFLALAPIFSVLASPAINILNIKLTDIDGKTAQIEWSTDVATNGKVMFGEDKDNLSYFIADSKAASKYHKVVLGNLKGDTDYYYQISAYDNTEKVESFINKFTTKDFHDGIAPKLSDIKLSYVSGTAAVIEWKTDEEGTSVVQYGEDITFKKKISSSKKVKEHQVIIKKLKPATYYYVRIYSVDKDKNKSGYGFKEFTTRDTDKLDKEDLTISYLRPSGPDDTQVLSTSIKVTFKTNHFANGTVSLSAKGMKTKKETLEYGLDHSAFFSSLEAGKEYTVSVSMKDIFGKKDSEKFNVITRKFVPAPAPEVGGDEDVIVLGKDYSFYTPAKALYRVAGKVYSIVSNMYFYITSPASFYEYGYEWGDVKNIDAGTLNKYSRVKLVTAPDNSAVYYLYKRNGRISKIKIPSPTVFNSYAGNKWENVVKISRLDIDAYPNVKLVKAQNDTAVYYLDENNVKHYVSYDIFVKKEFSFGEVMEVNGVHLDSYKMGEGLK